MVIDFRRYVDSWDNIDICMYNNIYLHLDDRILFWSYCADVCKDKLQNANTDTRERVVIPLEALKLRAQWRAVVPAIYSS